MSTDIPDLIAGALGVSRGTAYDMMREALDKEDIYRLAAESIKEGLRLDDWDKIGCVNHDCDKCKAQQEPLGYIAIMALNDLQASIYRDVAVYGEDLEDTVAIYTTPQAQPAREWVGLTKEDKAEIVAATERDDRGYVMALVEAKLMEKNT